MVLLQSWAEEVGFPSWRTYFVMGRVPQTHCGGWENGFESVFTALDKDEPTRMLAQAVRDAFATWRGENDKAICTRARSIAILIQQLICNVQPAGWTSAVGPEPGCRARISLRALFSPIPVLQAGYSPALNPRFMRSEFTRMMLCACMNRRERKRDSAHHLN